jgi:hypothetical protein
MSKALHFFFQALGFLIQVVNVAAFPAAYQPFVATVVSLAQAGLALYNHTPAAPTPAA